MAVTFISNDIWPRLRRLAKSRGRRAFVAVPFLGLGAAKRLPLRRGDILVTKFDTASVRAGLVSPREVVTFIERGVEVHSVRNLHAKVYVFGRTAVVTSSNVSATSEHRLVEAACELSLPDIVAQCRDFVLGLRGEVVELKFARSQIPFWRPPKSPYGKKVLASHSGRTIEQSPLVAVSLDELGYDDADVTAASTAQATARDRVADHSKFKLDDFRWTGILPKTLKRGVRVLMCTETAHGRVNVTPPARVLEVHRYRSRRGANRAIVVVEVRKYVRDKHLRVLLKALGPTGAPLKALRGAKPLRNSTLVYRLGQLWPTVSGDAA